MEFDGMRPAIPDAIRDVGVVAIGRRLEAGRVAIIADALVAGGVRAFELTLNEPEGPVLASITELARRFSDTHLLVGAGTVLTASQVDEAVSAGAKFLVSPGATRKLADAAAAGSAPLLPGVATASEAMAMAEMGHHVLKFFPAEPAGGVNYLKSLGAPPPPGNRTFGLS